MEQFKIYLVSFRKSVHFNDSCDSYLVADVDTLRWILLRLSDIECYGCLHLKFVLEIFIGCLSSYHINIHVPTDYDMCDVRNFPIFNCDRVIKQHFLKITIRRFSAHLILFDQTIFFSAVSSLSLFSTCNIFWSTNSSHWFLSKASYL